MRVPAQMNLPRGTAAQVQCPTPVPWSLFPGPWSLVPGPCSLVPVPWSLVPGPCSLVPGPWSLLLNVCFLGVSRCNPVKNLPSHTKQSENFLKSIGIYIAECAILVSVVEKRPAFPAGLRFWGERRTANARIQTHRPIPPPPDHFVASSRALFTLHFSLNHCSLTTDH